MRDRRQSAHSFAGFLIPWSTEKLGLLGARDVSSAVIAEPGRNPSARNRRPKTIRLRDDPVCQQASIRIPGNTEPLPIQRIMPDRVVHTTHHVLILDFPP